MPAPLPQNPDALGTSAHFAAYADAAVPIDLVAEGLSNCRRIRVGGEGTLVVRRASDGVQVMLTFLAGETMEVSARAIESGTATNIVVFW